MSSSALKLLAASGATDSATYVDDVFSTFLFSGTGSNQTITNGVDLSGEGGLVWGKCRNNANWNYLFDTERGAGNVIYSNAADAQGSTGTSYLYAFNNNGFSMGPGISVSGQNHVGWSFRKAPGFFDIVTYTGNATSGRTVSHNLGSAPGMIIVKRLDGQGDWYVYHRSTGNNKITYLNDTAASATNSSWNNTDPTSTEFTVSNASTTNGNNLTYVAYLFAHDAQDFGTDEDEAIIKCGSYTGNGNADGPTIDLGFEPQWLLLKSADGSDGWQIVDVMRNWSSNPGGTAASQAALIPNSSSPENNISGTYKPTSTGFKITAGGGLQNDNGYQYIYMAIRRPNKPAEEFDPDKLLATPSFYTSGDPVFQLINASASDPIDFTIDLAITRHGGAPDNTEISSRLMQGQRLFTNKPDAQATDSNMVFDYSNGYHAGVSGATASMVGHGFRRAPGFFDLVCYTGSSSSGTQTINHNLGVVPEMMWVKARNASYNWWAAHTFTGSGAVRQYPAINGNGAGSTESYGTSLGLNAQPTSTAFVVNTDTMIGRNYDWIAYLFASVDGISKVGTYTANGNEQTIDCGFAAGARFVVIKRTNATGNWFYSYDYYIASAYSGSRLYAFNDEETDYVTQGIKVASTGFTIQASNSNTNASGGTYLFYAIA